MTATSKFAGFALAAVFGIALGVGAAIGPEPSGPVGRDARAAGPATPRRVRPGPTARRNARQRARLHAATGQLAGPRR